MLLRDKAQEKGFGVLTAGTEFREEERAELREENKTELREAQNFGVLAEAQS
jgi:hypothetical protein